VFALEMVEVEPLVVGAEAVGTVGEVRDQLAEAAGVDSPPKALRKVLTGPLG
jgi:type IV secretory pathway VirB2 component (pilin)